MFRSIFTNSFGILTSRILGFIRDMLQASIIGANIYSDIFIVAFKLPNLFRRIFAEGAFTQSFLPAFTASRQKSIFSMKIFLGFITFLLLLSLIVTLFSPLFTKIIATGFSREVVAKAAPLVAINFYYLPLIFITTFLATLLQYKNHFATTAFSTALLNVSMITALLLSKEASKEQIIYNLSIAVVVGGLLQVLTHIIAIKKFSLHKIVIGGFQRVFKKGSLIKDDISKFNSQFFASTLGSSTAQISAFLDGWLASFLLSGSISYLYYANRLFQFPLALFAIATSVAIFPKVAKYIKNKQLQKAREMLKRSFWFLIMILTVAMITGIMLNDEIVWLLYERGEFSREDTANTALVLTMYLIGLLPFGISRIFSLWLYSTDRQKDAAKISAYSLGLNIILSIALIYPFKASGLALASSLSGFLLLYLTIKAYGKEEFLDIIDKKRVILLIAVIALTIALNLVLKGYIDAFIQ